MTLDSNLQIDDSAVTRFLLKARQNIASLDSTDTLRAAGQVAIADARQSILISREAINEPGQFGASFPALVSGEQRRPMVKTGAMLNSFSVLVSKGIVRTGNTRSYASEQNERRAFFNATRQQNLIFAELEARLDEALL